MTKLTILFILPFLIVALSIPLILGKVAPNGAYGFRTTKTLSSPDVWYPANRAAGWFMVGAGVISIILNLCLWRIFPEWPPDKTASWMVGGSMIPVAIAALVSFLYIGRL